MYKAITALLRYIFSMPSKEINPVHWDFAAKKESFNNYKIYITATIDAPWRLHAQESPLDGPLPLPIMVRFEENTFVNFKGMPLEEGDLKVDFDKQGAIKVCYYMETVKIIQEVQLYTQEETITGKIIYMPCTESKYLNPEELKFHITLN